MVKPVPVYKPTTIVVKNSTTPEPTTIFPMISSGKLSVGHERDDEEYQLSFWRRGCREGNE